MFFHATKNLGFELAICQYQPYLICMFLYIGLRMCDVCKGIYKELYSEI